MEKTIKNIYNIIQGDYPEDLKDKIVLRDFSGTNFNLLKKKYRQFVEICNMISEIEIWYKKADDKLLMSTILQENELKNKKFQMYKLFNKNYRLNTYNFQKRLCALKEIGEVFLKSNNDLVLADVLKKHFNSPDSLYSSYKNMIANIDKDDRLDSIKEYLVNLDIYVEKYRELIKDGTVVNLKGLLSDQKEFESENGFKNYCNFIVNEYINSSEYWDYRFFSTYGITYDVLKKCVSYIESTDCNLYEQFLQACQIKEMKRTTAVKYTFNMLADAIKTGYLNDGTKLDKLEYLKRTPIKGKNLFNKTADFVSKYCDADVYKTIMDYLKQNNIYEYNLDVISDFDFLRKSGYGVSKRTLCGDDTDIVLHYMYSRDIPLYKTTFREAAEMYANNVYVLDDVNMESKPRINHKKTIIPSLTRKR